MAKTCSKTKMSSVPALPEVGSNASIHVARVNLSPHTVLVEFGGTFNQEAYQHLKDMVVSRKPQHAFEGQPGEICLAYEDKTWCRARILLKCELEYKVFLIDDGAILWVSSKVLTKCPRNLSELPPKVELCVLACVSPLCLETAWTQSASKFIRSLSGKDLSGCVQDVILPSRIILLNIPSVSKQMYELGFARKTPNEDFKSLVMHSLHLPRRKSSVQKEIPASNVHASDPNKLNQYLYPELLPGTIEIVTVTQVIHPSKIYCRLNVFSQELKKLSDQLHEFFEDSDQSPTPLSDGFPCATKGSDGKWYRSVLQQNTVSDVVKVFHVDYGIGDFIKLCNIRPLPVIFFQLPVVTYTCSLHGVINKGVGWRTDQIDYLKSLLLDQILVGKFQHHCVNEGVYYITLYGDDNVNVNDTFGQREQCLSGTERICDDQVLKTIRSLRSASLAGCANVHEDARLVRPSKIEDDPQPSKKGHSPCIAPPLLSDTYVDSPFKLEVGTKERVRITCVQSVNKFYGHLVQNMETVRKMTKDIQQLCRKRQQAKTSISPNMMCLAKYLDGQWHRGKIESTHPKILVQFVDYGDLMIIDKSDILPLPTAFASIPIQAVKFELFNVTLPEQCELNEWFKDYATDRMFTVIMKQNSSGKLSVEMYDERTNLNEKVKEQWNRTKRKLSNFGKGNVQREFPEATAFRGQRQEFSTSSQAREKPKKVPPVQGKFEQVNQTGHTARPNALNQQVTYHYPKLADLPTRALNAGYVSDVYVSHCNSPSSFFVQLTSDENEIFSLLDQLNSGRASGAQVELNLLQSGDLVLAEYPADGAFYRAVVQNKRDGMAQVHFIDFGNEQSLLPCKIKQLGKQFLRTSRLSIHCTLEDGRKAGRTDWTQEERMTFKKAAGENGDKKIQCKFIREDSSAWLVSLEYQGAPLFNSALKSDPQTKSRTRRNENGQPLAFKEPAVTQGQIVEGYASSIVGPNYFWCQFKNSEELDRISLLAQEFGIDSQTKPIQPDQLRQGGLCMARFSDQLWYRAQVLNAHEKSVTVLFIDYGNESEIDLCSVKSLPNKLLDKPPQAFLCQLEALGSTDGTWSDDAADRFFEILVDEPLKLTIQNKVMSTDLPKCPRYYVLVECKGENVNDLMKGYWCDTKVEAASFETVEKDEDPKLISDAKQGNDLLERLQQHDGCRMERVAPVTQDQSNTFSTLTEKVGNPIVQSVQGLPRDVDLPPQLIEAGTETEVYVSHIKSLTSFFVQLAENETTLFSLSELLNAPQASEKHEINALSVSQGSLVKAMFPEDEAWYRAAVKSSTDNGNIQVEFIDFGNETTVSLSGIHQLDEQLLSYPRFSIYCTSSVDQRFKMQTEAEQMMLFKQIFGDAGEHKLSCKFIKEDASAWEVKLTPIGSTSDSLMEKWDNLDLNSLASEPVKEPLLFKRPDVSLGQTVEAFASCIVEPNYFWCQFSNSEILDQITHVAQEYGNSSAMQTILLENLDPGSLCLARFSDDMWYRAHVIKKGKDSISVLFVDFGNESENTEGSVKALPCGLLESPPQAFLCRLGGFDPSCGLWDSAAIDAFYELLVDKPLKITVEHIDNSTNPSKPPFHVQVETPQCLANEHMMKFWSEHGQSSTEEMVSTSLEDETSASLAISPEEHRPSESYVQECEGKISKAEVKCDSHEANDQRSAITDVLVESSAMTHSVLKVREVSGDGESGDGVRVGSAEPLIKEESRNDLEDPEKDVPKTPSRSSDWVAAVENQMLPMVCNEDSCDSVKCLFK